MDEGYAVELVRASDGSVSMEVYIVRSKSSAWINSIPISGPMPHLKDERPPKLFVLMEKKK